MAPVRDDEMEAETKASGNWKARNPRPTGRESGFFTSVAWLRLFVVGRAGRAQALPALGLVFPNPARFRLPHWKAWGGLNRNPRSTTMRTIQQIFSILQSRASSSLTDDDLQALTGATSFAKNMALEARDVFMGIGCLVDSDQGSTGNLSTADDIPCLLYHGANTFDLIFSLIEMGEDASYTLGMRRQAASRERPQDKAAEGQASAMQVEA